ncbi:EAL domain-containing protein [Novosphingobium profundi]|uniref:bifunctional diguanylate cyclase/phosphodiesterase n=1 Tax=Novosphingobium profundi TaxID=1774954 RepID=UPI001BDA66E0|nr:EAL domain-containing protein [Novosphingobium profundi]MBT0667146.1 EAL domain-containing protein [Novosphingobium profundi]
MLDILSCIRDDHDLRYVFAAGLICMLSSATTMLLLRHAVSGTGRARLNATLLAGAAGGFGIWATHFIAMLGYAPGIIAGYDLALTLASLLVAVLMISLGLVALTREAGSRHVSIALGAAITGLGISAMHYCGMMALQLPAQLDWRSGYVLGSFVAAIVPLVPAFHLVLSRPRQSRFAGAALLLAAAILALHFLGMTGLVITPSRLEAHGGTISPLTMDFIVGAISLGLLALAVTGLLLVRSTQAVAQASERQFSLLVKGISDYALYILDLEGRVASWNAGAERLKGYRADEVLGCAVETFYTPEDREKGLAFKALGIATVTGKFTGEGWRVRRDGSRFWAQVTIEVVKDERGHPIGFAKITRDVTQRKEDQDRIAAIGQQRDAALGHMHQGLCLFDADERLVLRNARFLEMYELEEDDLPAGLSHREVIRIVLEAKTGQTVSEEDVEKARQLVLNCRTNPAQAPIVSELSEEFVVSISSRKLPDGGWVSTFDDITNQRQSEARIAHMALHDGLTGLANRTCLNLWLDEALGQAQHLRRKLAVAVFDLNRFKDINDSFGHAWGDVVLQEIARRLRANLLEDEFAARLGGDEFGVGKPYTSDHQLNDFVNRLEKCFEVPFEHQGQTLHFGASIGVSAFPADGKERETLLNNADLAMYRAKGQLGENLCFYESSMDESARARRKLASDLRQAIERQELALLYQPQCFLEDGRLSGYEALLRWHHPLRGVISPVEFIPIAEEAGLIIQIGEWVLEQACREATRWPVDHRVAVNLSPIQLVQPDIAQTVTRVLIETGLPARRLELEITESAIITDKARALHNLRQIKALGVGIAMDDFGTGYSSLDTLQSFPFDKIKIDKSFLLQSNGNDQAQAIIRAVLALGQSLKIPVLAEGVETEEHLHLLLSEGCQEAQGYFLGRPGHAPSLTSAMPEPSAEPLIPIVGAA